MSSPRKDVIMEENKNSLVLKIIKGVLLLLGVVAMIGFIAHFIMGIRDSLFNDDVITAQDRIKGAYQFLRMVLAGLVALCFFVPTIFIKVNLLPEHLFKKKELEAKQSE